MIPPRPSAGGKKHTTQAPFDERGRKAKKPLPHQGGGVWQFHPAPEAKPFHRLATIRRAQKARLKKPPPVQGLGRKAIPKKAGIEHQSAA